MACGTSSCGGYGGHGGLGGEGSGAGRGGVLVDTGKTISVHIQPDSCSFTCPGPYLVCHSNPRVSCHCVCASECCSPSCCGSGAYGGHGGCGPGMRVDMCYSGYDVIMPAPYLCSSAHRGNVSTSCCEPCCGPC